MKRFFGIFLFLFISALLSNLNTSAGTLNWPPPFLNFKKCADDNSSLKGNIITGIASYYAQKFEGNLTATGEVFKHSKLTGASNVFALNTWVKVTNILTGKSIIVRINDRMHAGMSKKGRVLDLTMTAAKQLKIVKSGLAKVSIQEISADDVAVAN